MRQLQECVSGVDFIGFHVERLGTDYVSSVTYCDGEGPHTITMFMVPMRLGWEGQLCKWIVDLWSVLLEDPVVVGGCYSDFPQVSGLLWQESGRSGICLRPIVIQTVTKFITASVVAVFGGQDIVVVMNYFVSRLRDYVADPLIADCPNLLRVS